MSHNLIRLFALWVLSLPGITFANLITYNLDTEFTGGSVPMGTAPWLTATFDDSAGDGSVRLTMAAPGLAAGEYVSNWYFTLDPAYLPSHLNFAAIDISDSVPAIVLNDSGFSIGSESGFDVRFAFPTSNAGGGTARFTTGESVIFDLSSTDGPLSVASFQFLTSPSGYASAARVQGIDADPDGGWLGATPDNPVAAPNTLALLSLGLVWILRRRQAQALLQQP